THLLSRIPNLQDLTYKPGPPPPALLTALLKHHPTARLHLPEWYRLDASLNHNSASELALAHCLNLHSIHARCSRGKFDYSIPAVKRIVALAPSLKEVDISIVTTGGCIATAWTDEEWQEEQRLAALFVSGLPQTKMAALQSLKLDCE